MDGRLVGVVVLVRVLSFLKSSDDVELGIRKVDVLLKKLVLDRCPVREKAVTGSIHCERSLVSRPKERTKSPGPPQWQGTCRARLPEQDA